MKILILCSALTFYSVLALYSEAPDRIYYYLAASQTREGPVGGDFYSTAAQGLCAIAFLKRGHPNRAKRILNFYDDIYRIIKSSTEFVGFCEAYDIKKQPVSETIDYLSQLSLARAILDYTSKTGDRRFLPIAEAIASVFMKQVNRWGAFVDKDSKRMYVQQNLFAYALFGKLCGVIENPDYVKTAKRLKFVLEDLFFVPSRKMLKYEAMADRFEQRDQIFGKLIFDSNINISTGTLTAVDEMAWHELAKIAANENRTYRLENYLRFLPDLTDGEFISEGENNPSVNLTATVLYAFMKERFNPFAIDESCKAKISLADVTKGEIYQYENFEEDTINFYTATSPKTLNANVSIQYDDMVKKEGDRGLRIQFVPLKAEKSTAEITRLFYPTQDFTKFSRLKFWLSARPSNPAPGILGLKVKLKFIDTEGNIGESKFLYYSARGVDNTLIIPAGFSPTGKTSPDATKIKALIWYFEETTPMSWNVVIDDIRLE